MKPLGFKELRTLALLRKTWKTVPAPMSRMSAVLLVSGIIAAILLFTLPAPDDINNPTEFINDGCHYLVYRENGKASVVHKGNCPNHGTQRGEDNKP